MDLNQSFCGLVPKYPAWHTMPMNVPSVIKALLAATGWSQAILAERIGVNQNYISRWLHGVEPRGQNMEAIRSLAIQHGLLGDDATRQFIPIMGYVGAGGDVDPDFEQVPFDGLEQVELPRPIGLLEDPIGFIVRGEIMLPRYDDGSIVVVEREPTRSFEAIIGEEAVVMTHDGKRYLRKVMPTDRLGVYRLVGLNAPSFDVSIRWASKVQIVLARGVGRRRQQPTTPQALLDGLQQKGKRA